MTRVLSFSLAFQNVPDMANAAAAAAAAAKSVHHSISPPPDNRMETEGERHFVGESMSEGDPSFLLFSLFLGLLPAASTDSFEKGGCLLCLFYMISKAKCVEGQSKRNKLLLCPFLQNNIVGKLATDWKCRSALWLSVSVKSSINCSDIIYNRSHE